MKARPRTCAGCGKVEFTASTTRLCLICFCADKSRRNRDADRLLLEDIYHDVEFAGKDAHGKATWTVTHDVCKTRQTWMVGNAKKQLKARPGITPCSRCGGMERVQKAMDGYLEKYGRDWTAADRANWMEYSRAVRKLSEVTYKKHRAIINPLGLKRGMRDHHLDHVVPIIECFVQGWLPEKAAEVGNLQMLSAGDNLTKGRR